MSMRIVRSKVKAEHVGDVENAIKGVFAALEETQPDGLRYAACRLPDGVTYVALVQLDDGIENPLAALSEFLAFQENLKAWLAEPPIPEQATIIGSYRFF